MKKPAFPPLRVTMAHLVENSPRADVWRQILGGLEVRIESPVDQLADLPGIGRARVYKLAVASLSAEQRQRLIDSIVQRFGVPRSEVEAGIDAPGVGVPILADDVVVVFDGRMVL